MKILLDIKDNQASFFMEMLKHFPFVKATPLTDPKAEFLKGFRQAVDEVKLAKQGKIKTTPLNEFLNELPN